MSRDSVSITRRIFGRWKNLFLDIIKFMIYNQFMDKQIAQKEYLSRVLLRARACLGACTHVYVPGCVRECVQKKCVSDCYKTISLLFFCRSTFTEATLLHYPVSHELWLSYGGIRAIHYYPLNFYIIHCITLDFPQTINATVPLGVLSDAENHSLACHCLQNTIRESCPSPDEIIKAELEEIPFDLFDPFSSVGLSDSPSIRPTVGP